VEKWNIVDAVNLKREERNQYSTYLLCTSYGDTYTKRQGHRQEFFFCTQLRQQLYHKRTQFCKTNNTANINVEFFMLCSESIDGIREVHSRLPVLRKDQLQLKKVFFFSEVVDELGLRNKVEL